ncbi:general stress protein [Georgenia sp. MJ170]|uniref:general stress protein n=1 Tax=Georgenia sunbinii TaxID=3117728 RepID=UPI002F260322
MSFMSKGGVPQAPTLPTGVQIATFDTYLEAQRAVDHLSDKEFKVQHTTIVGTDLRMVERITGRLSYPRVALAGAMSGAWFGLFVGLLFGLLSEGSIALMLLPALVIGAAFGIMFGLVSYAFTGGKRDFTSSSQVVAGRYALLCDESVVGEARRLLEEAGFRTRVGAEAPPAQGWAGAPQQPAPGATPGPYGRPAVTPPVAGEAAPPSAEPAGETAEQPRAPFQPWQDEHGNPRYGQRRPQQEQGPTDGDAR